MVNNMEGYNVWYDVIIYILMITIALITLYFVNYIMGVKTTDIEIMSVIIIISTLEILFALKEVSKCR